MSVFNHFKDINLSETQEIALTKLEVFFASPLPVFILKGYAGTGKTMLLKGIVEFLDSCEKNFTVMAPTGRAAKILKDKTGYGSTIHKGIYNYEKLESVNSDAEDEADHSFHYYFPINKLSDEVNIIIIDEASMISAVESKNELFTFGTNNLLNDLLTFAALQTSKNKIIFVGDPAQLPPVNDSHSLALDKDYFEKDLGIGVEEFELTDIHRQGNNLILENSQALRKLLQQEKRPGFSFKFDDNTFIHSDSSDFVDKFTDIFPVPEIGNGVIISYSNSQCYHYNVAVRKKIFPGQQNVVPGDLLLINSNNYHTYGAELFNGDFAKVISVDQDIVSQSAPVYLDIKGKKKRVVIQLDFKKISIRVPSCSNEITCYIILSLLHNLSRDLSVFEMRALYINFLMRFNEEQKRRRENGLSSYKVGSEEFKQKLKADPFFNALRVKFGYAITCHKAQGGEWDKVFVDYYGNVSLKDHPIRWCYTATTRAKNSLYAINPPYFKEMARLKFTEIGRIGKLPLESLSFAHVPLSPFHDEGMHPCKSLKYWEIKEKLDSKQYVIKNVESLGDYLERYTVEDSGGQIIVLQASHRSSGHFVERFKIMNDVDAEVALELEMIFNEGYAGLFLINYHPSEEFLHTLYSRMQQACSELDITITNITETKNFVNYYLKTSSVCSYIQFYFNSKGQLTSAMPKTFECDHDTKMISLIEKLSYYAS
jgi:hypothetical protein